MTKIKEEDQEDLILSDQSDEKIAYLKDESLTIDLDYDFSENIKLEPEIFLSEQEPMSEMRFLQQRGNPSIHPCNQCDYIAVNKPNLKYPIESVHLGIRYPCEQCDYMAKKKFQLRNHVLTKHEEKTFPCNQCEYVANQRGNLLKHVKSKHEGREYI